MGPSGNLDVTIYTTSGSSCFAYHLDNSDNNFNKCDVDTFREDSIGECYNFNVPGYDITQLRVQHSGTDSWKGEYVK